MFRQIITLLAFAAVTYASLFDFLNNQFAAGGQQQRQSPFEYEASVLKNECSKYLCPDTLKCVDAPKFCPCPYPSSQLRCFLPDGRYMCISKPAGEISSKYDDPSTNWKVDAKDDNIRDCGWVARAWKGEV